MEWELGHIILLILRLKRLNLASNMALKGHFWDFREVLLKISVNRCFGIIHVMQKDLKCQKDTLRT